MNILIIDMYNNGLFAANKLSKQYPSIEKVILISEFVRPSMWQTDRLEIVTGRLSISQVIEIVKTHSIDIVINFNSMYGQAGVIEALSAIGISCVGSNQAFSNTETNKYEFRQWLTANDFKTPAIRVTGLYEDIEPLIGSLGFPLVIKPDVQVGPPVKPCHSKEELITYFDNAFAKAPYAKTAVLFTIEDYIPLLDELYATYFICDGIPTLWESNRLPNNWKKTRDAGECAYALVPNPNFPHYREEIEAYLSKITEFTDNAIGIVQCGIAENGDLYFIESNARPPTAGLGMFDDPLAVINALHKKDNPALQQQLAMVKSEGATIALMHQDDAIEVDIDALNNLPNCSYWPNSIEKENGKAISYKKGAPSFLHVYGSGIDDIAERIESLLPTIEATGNYLAINPLSVSKLYQIQNID